MVAPPEILEGDAEVMGDAGWKCQFKSGAANFTVKVDGKRGEISVSQVYKFTRYGNIWFYNRIV